MKKGLLIGAIVGVIVTTLGLAGFAYAQTQTPPTPTSPDQPYGTGSWRGHGMMSGYWGPRGSSVGKFSAQGGLLHEYMLNAFASALGLPTDELQARLDSGETMWQIAESSGMSYEEFRTLMSEARSEAITQALAEGVITQEQADWMLAHLNQMAEYGYGPGYGPCHEGSLSQGAFFRGPGWGSNGQPSP